MLASAYTDKVNDIARQFLEASNVRVLDAQGLSLVDNLVVGRLSADTAYDLAMKVDRPDADAIVLSCTNWASMDAIERIEKAVGKPVVSTTQVSIWAALRMIGWTKPVEGYGRLLRGLSA